MTEIEGLEVAEGDRVYRSDEGHVVKVRTRRVETGSPARLAFVLTGSLCDEDGQALPFEGGHFIVDPHEMAINSDTTPDVAALIAAEHEAMVRRVERAAVNQAQLAGLGIA